MQGGAYKQHGQGVQEVGVTAAASFYGKVGGGHSWSGTSPGLSLGKFWAFGPLDAEIFLARRVTCR